MPENWLDGFIPEAPKIVEIKSETIEGNIELPQSVLDVIQSSNLSMDDGIEMLNKCCTSNNAMSYTLNNANIWWLCRHNTGKIKDEYRDVLLYFYNFILEKGYTFIGYYIENTNDDSIVWLEYDEVYAYKAECYYGWISRVDESYIDEGSDYVVDNQGNYYLDANVAEQHNVYYNSCCGEWVHEDNHECINREDDYFDNATKYTGKTTHTKTSSMTYTFGVEIETCSSVWCGDFGYNWKAVYDGSTNGPEFVTGILKGDYGVKQLESMSNALSEQGAKVDKKCGVHVHIGGAIHNRRLSIIILKLCLQIEQDIYAMLPESRASNNYCKKLPVDIIDRMNFKNYKEILGKFTTGYEIDRTYNKKKNHPNGHYNSQRYHWINLTNCSTKGGPDTIEFRPHSATIDFDKIYPWVLICMSIVKFAENQQRRIMNSSYSEQRITLQDVIKYSLNDAQYELVNEHIINRAKLFNQKHILYA